MHCDVVHTRLVIGVAALCILSKKCSYEFVHLVSCTSWLDIRVASSQFVPCFGFCYRQRLGLFFSSTFFMIRCIECREKIVISLLLDGV